MRRMTCLIAVGIAALAATTLVAGPIAFLRDLDMGTNAVKQVKAPTDPMDAATKAYVDAATAFADNSHIVYVNIETGNDTTGNGSFGKPYKTLAFAATTVVPPTTAAEMLQPVTFKVAPGRYAGNVVLPRRAKTALLGNHVVIEGNVEQYLTLQDYFGALTSNSNMPATVIYGESGGSHETMMVPAIRIDGNIVIGTVGSGNIGVWQFLIKQIGCSGSLIVTNYCAPTVTIVNTEFSDATKYLFSNAGTSIRPMLNIIDSKIKAAICGHWNLLEIRNSRIQKVDYSIDDIGGVFPGRIYGLGGAGYHSGFMDCRFEGTTFKFGSAAAGAPNPNAIGFDASSLTHLNRAGVTRTFDNVSIDMLESASAITNDSVVAGTTVKDALNTLNIAVTGGVTKAYVDGGDAASVTTASGDATTKADAAATNAIVAAAADATVKANAAAALKVSKAGDTMTGALTLPGAPTADLHAATKAYVDDATNGAVAAAATYTDAATKLTNLIWVAKNGTDAGADGSVAKPYLTIGAAAAAAHDGSTLFVAPGTYAENVVLPANVSLFGCGNSKTHIAGSITTTGSSPISLKDFSTTGLITFDTHVMMNNVYSSGGFLVKSGASQAINSHIFRNDGADDGAGITIEGGQLNLLLSTVQSKGSYPAVAQTGGTLIANQTKFQSAYAAGSTVESSAGTFNAGFSQILNLGGGTAASLINGATALAPNGLADVVAVGNIVCGNATIYVGQLQFPSGSTLAGTAIVYCPAGRIRNDSTVAGATVKDALNTLGSGTLPAVSNAFVLKSGDAMTGTLAVDASNVASPPSFETGGGVSVRVTPQVGTTNAVSIRGRISQSDVSTETRGIRGVSGNANSIGGQASTVNGGYFNAKIYGTATNGANLVEGVAGDAEVESGATGFAITNMLIGGRFGAQAGNAGLASGIGVLGMAAEAHLGQNVGVFGFAAASASSSIGAVGAAQATQVELMSVSGGQLGVGVYAYNPVGAALVAVGSSNYFSGNITIGTTPVNANHAATKKYVDDTLAAGATVSYDVISGVTTNAAGVLTGYTAKTVTVTKGIVTSVVDK